MDKNDVKEIVNTEIKKFVNDSFDKEVKKVLHNSGSKTRDEMISSIKNAFEAVYRVLWQKKDFWKSDIR